METELKKEENIIWENHGTESFCALGKALGKIRSKKLYRGNYKNFHTYCRNRWDMAPRTAYQYINAFKVVENLRNCAQVLPANEAQARPLAKCTPEKQREAWKFIVKNAPGGTITAKYIKKVVRKYLEGGAQEKKPLTDGFFKNILEAFSICKKVGEESTTINTGEKFREFLTNCKEIFEDKPECYNLPGVFRIVVSNEHCKTMFCISRNDNGNFQETGPNQFKQTTDSDPFEVLGVKNGASKDELKSAFRSFSKMYHPDTLGRLNIDEAHKWIIEEADNRMKIINSAYETLCD